jgi:23S rRNA pseudouridine2605 synthase
MNEKSKTKPKSSSYVSRTSTSSHSSRNKSSASNSNANSNSNNRTEEVSKNKQTYVRSESKSVSASTTDRSDRRSDKFVRSDKENTDNKNNFQKKTSTPFRTPVAKLNRTHSAKQHNQHTNNQITEDATPAEEPIRIQKMLSELGIDSRRNIEILITQGRIKVNGKVAILGQKIGVTDEISVNGQKINLNRKKWVKPRVIAYHKPSGEIVSERDPENRPSVFDNLPRVRNGKWIAIGRLDYNTEGLLLFTNNGEIANALMHPKFKFEREYAVRIIGSLSAEQTKALLNGVLLEDGLAKFSKIQDAGGENLNHWYHVILSEGRNREIRRMFEAVGLTVSRLTRIRYAGITLSSRLQRGRHEELSDEQMAQLIVDIEKAGHVIKI